MVKPLAEVLIAPKESDKPELKKVTKSRKLIKYPARNRLKQDQDST